MNTNSSWLAQKITELGFTITRITTLSDDFNDLKQGFVEALNRNPSIIISTGGLGPTWDDRTAEGLALALDKPLKVDSRAHEMIVNRYQLLRASLNPASEKMANLPEGSVPLPNSVGTAPGIRYNTDKTLIYCLPGVPKEMKAIFLEDIIIELQKMNPEIHYYQTEFDILGIGESRTASISSSFTERYPKIYIKSHPSQELTSDGMKSRITFHLTTFGSSDNEELLIKVKEELKTELVKIGAKLI
ncbi:MAG: molybdopterin-binding protein [Candidatus Thorarchaeota archaeon]